MWTCSEAYIVDEKGIVMSKREHVQVLTPDELAAKTWDVLQKAGLLFDQDKARRMMEAARLHLRLDVTQDRIDRAWLRHIVCRKWRTFDYEDFVNERGVNPRNYGGRVPFEIRTRVDKVQTLAPWERFIVHAKAVDPWILTTSGVIIGGYVHNTWEEKATILL